MHLLRKRAANIVAWTFVVLTCLSIIPAFIFYLNWSSERDAEVFCNRISYNSPISDAILKAEKIGLKHHYSFSNKMGYSFVFHGFVMGKAYCNVILTKEGTVVSKTTEFQDD